MNPNVLFFLTALPTLVFIVPLVLAKYFNKSKLIWVVKPITSLGFLLPAIFAPTTSIAMLIGFSLSLVGDIVLILEAEWAFMVGLIAFAGAHICYIAYFVQVGIEWGTMGIVVIPYILVGIVYGGRVISKAPKNMRIPVLAYMIIITIMVSFGSGTRQWKQIIGAVLFYASDMFVARQAFLTQGFTNYLVGWPLYYFGQLFLAWSLF